MPNGLYRYHRDSMVYISFYLRFRMYTVGSYYHRGILSYFFNFATNN